jgi:hypothetical protein
VADCRSTKARRAIVRDLLGGKVDLVPGEDGSLSAEYGLHMAALLQGAGTVVGVKRYTLFLRCWFGSE